MNRKGVGFLFIFVALIAVLVLTIVGTLLGLKFMDNIVAGLGSNKLLVLMLIAAILVFHNFVEMVLITVFGWIKAIVGKFV